MIERERDDELNMEFHLYIDIRSVNHLAYRQFYFNILHRLYWITMNVITFGFDRAVAVYE